MTPTRKRAAPGADSSGKKHRAERFRENSVRFGSRGSGVDYGEPLFVGGGVAGAMTEAELKFMVYDNVRTVWTSKTMSESLSPGPRARELARMSIGSRADVEKMCTDHFINKYGRDTAMKRDFAIKALTSPRSESPHVKLNPTVKRISILVGRTDLPGRARTGA